MEVLYVAVGGAFGSAGRYLVDRTYGPSTYPIETLTVNRVGSFRLGLLVGWIGDRVAPGVRLALFTGVLGGFTTFSTFALESTVMLRAGDTATGIGYIVLSVAGGIGLAMVGLLAGEGMA